MLGKRICPSAQYKQKTLPSRHKARLPRQKFCFICCVCVRAHYTDTAAKNTYNASGHPVVWQLPKIAKSITQCAMQTIPARTFQNLPTRKTVLSPLAKSWRASERQCSLHELYVCLYNSHSDIFCRFTANEPRRCTFVQTVVCVPMFVRMFVLESSAKDAISYDANYLSWHTWLYNNLVCVVF